MKDFLDILSRLSNLSRCFFISPPHVVTQVDEDTEGSTRSGQDSMTASGDLFLGPAVNGNISKDDTLKHREKVERKKSNREKENEKDKDKNKAKKGVLKGLGEMFR